MSSQKKRILLAEDSAADAELTQLALKRARINNDIDVVHDGKDLLDYLNASRTEHEMPLFILLDLKMPRLNGLEALEKIKSNARTSRIPVVMLTSSKEEGDLVRSYELGVNAYVVKPVAYNDFSVALEQLGKFWANINEVSH